MLCAPNAERAQEVAQLRTQVLRDASLAILDEEKIENYESEAGLRAQLEAAEDSITADAKLRGERKKRVIKNEIRKAEESIKSEYDKSKEVGPLRVPVVVRANTYGSLDAIKKLIGQLPQDEIVGEVVNEGVGDFLPTDIHRLTVEGSRGGILLGFNVQPLPRDLLKVAQSFKIDVYNASIIYQLGDSVKDALSDRLAPEITTEVVSEAEVKAVFPLKNNKDKKNQYKIAGCTVREGDMKQAGHYRVMRGEECIFQTSEGASSMRHFKEEVNEIKKGNDCGIGFSSFQDFELGDVIQQIKETKVPRKLDWITTYQNTNIKDQFT